ncbi:MJ0042-type zinc finger domain-containing protein [Candidatus Fokinia solitaria]|nr:MJ0042-type zinc finger domain-containing protein [Candidatus Fokinia solitaria]
MSNIRCDNCGAVFRISENTLLVDHPRFVRCGVCEHEWLAEASDLIPELTEQYDAVHSVIPQNAEYVARESDSKAMKMIFNVVCGFLLLLLFINLFTLLFIYKAEVIGSVFPIMRTIYEKLGLEFWS